MRLLPQLIELAGYLAVMACLYFLNPILLLGAGGLAGIGLGIALQRSMEKPD